MAWLRFPRLLGLLGCVYFLGMSAFFGYTATENTEFGRNAQQTTGTVVALVAKPLPGGRLPSGQHRTPKAPTVRFEVAGRSYHYTPARGRWRPTLQVGDQVTVLYDPSDPAGSARLEGEGRVALPLVAIGFLVVVAGLVVVLVLTRPGRVAAGPSTTSGGSAAAGGPPRPVAD